MSVEELELLGSGKYPEAALRGILKMVPFWRGRWWVWSTGWNQPAKS